MLRFWFILIIIGFLSCTKENVSEYEDISGEIFNYSECKNFLRAVSYSRNTSCVEYSYDKETKILILKHINSAFNCCPTLIYSKISLNKDTITISEFDKERLCKCICLYDLDIYMNDVNEQKYTLNFVEPYCGNQEKMIFDIDLKKQTTGIYCVNREQYPWGF